MAPSMTRILIERATRREDDRIFEVVLWSVLVRSLDLEHLSE